MGLTKKVITRCYCFILQSFTILTFILFYFNTQTYAQVGGAGGIIIRIPSSINVSDLDSILINDNTIIIEDLNYKDTIFIPTGSAYHLFRLVEDSEFDFYVFSIDNYFLGISNESNLSLSNNQVIKGLNQNSFTRLNANQDSTISLNSNQDSTTLDLISADETFINLNYYDSYLHCRVCESEYKGEIVHPFYQNNGVSPKDEVKSFFLGMHPEKDSISYFNLIEKYPNPPTCIGSIYFSVDTISSSYPFTIVAKPARNFLIIDSDGQLKILDKKEKEIANYPYMNLDKDLEKNWANYRKNFMPLDTLSSLVKVYILFYLLKNQPPRYFNKLNRNAKNLQNFLSKSFEGLAPASIVDQETWLEKTESLIGLSIDTKEEANMLLSNEMTRLALNSSWATDKNQYKDLLSLSKSDSIIQIKVLLLSTLSSGSDTIEVSINKLFDKIPLVKDSKEKFKLWSFFFYNLEKFSQTSLLGDKINQVVILNKQKMLTYFTSYLSQIISQNNPIKINEAINTITGLKIMEALKSVYPEKDKDFNFINKEFVSLINLISEVHYLGALYVNFNDLEKLHFHYRFLSYLRKLISNKSGKIISDRRNIVMNLINKK